MGIDVSPYEGPVIPVIYTINLRDPAGLFLASSFEMRNKDILYASNSVSVESTKFMNYLNTVNTTIQAPITTVTSAYGLRNIITRHRRCAQHLRDRRIDHSRHDADALIRASQ